MNINFEDIITKANARKDALLAVQSSMSEAKYMLGQLDELDAWAKVLRDRTVALDEEGRQLLGHPGIRAVFHLTSLISAVKNGMTYSDSNNGYSSTVHANGKAYNFNLNKLLEG